MGTTVPDPPTLHTSTDAGGPLALVNMVIGGRHSALHLRYHSCLWPEHLDSRGPGTADGTCGPPSSTERPTHKAEGGAPADCSEILCFFPTRSAEGGKLGYKGGGEGGAGRKREERKEGREKGGERGEGGEGKEEQEERKDVMKTGNCTLLNERSQSGKASHRVIPAQ